MAPFNPHLDHRAECPICQRESGKNWFGILVLEGGGLAPGRDRIARASVWYRHHHLVQVTLEKGIRKGDLHQALAALSCQRQWRRVPTP